MTDAPDPTPNRRLTRDERRKLPPEERALMRSAARLAAVQALYQMDMTGARWQAVATEFEAHRIGQEIEGAEYRSADIPHFRKLLEGVVTKQVAIDHLTDDALKDNWPLGRVDSILRALFRAAGFELLTMENIPTRAVISEYVDIARAFFDGKEPHFANAVLDAMARAARPGDFA